MVKAVGVTLMGQVNAAGDAFSPVSITVTVNTVETDPTVP
jgi:hypothetical protein